MNLTKCSSYKKSLPISYSLGVFPTLELLENKSEAVEQILLSSKSGSNEGVYKILALCKKKNIHFEYSDKSITRLGGNGSIYAVGVFKKYQNQLDQSANHLVLVNPQDTGNLGSIIRTALAFNVVNLSIISPAVDIFDPKTVRAAMGANFKINFAYFSSFEEYADKFTRPFFLFMTNGEQELSKVDFSSPCSFVFGSESAGLSKELTHYGKTVYINQSNQVDSLNLAVAVGVSLYQISNN